MRASTEAAHRRQKAQSVSASDSVRPCVARPQPLELHAHVHRDTRRSTCARVVRAHLRACFRRADTYVPACRLVFSFCEVLPVRLLAPRKTLSIRTKALCAAGYEEKPDGTFSNEKVFPKWREKYPEVCALLLKKVCLAKFCTTPAISCRHHTRTRTAAGRDWCHAQLHLRD